MLQQWAQRIRGKASLSQNVLIENGEMQPGLEGRIRGYRGKVVKQAGSKARYHIKARVEVVLRGHKVVSSRISPHRSIH